MPNYTLEYCAYYSETVTTTYQKEGEITISAKNEQEAEALARDQVLEMSRDLDEWDELSPSDCSGELKTVAFGEIKEQDA